MSLSVEQTELKKKTNTTCYNINIPESIEQSGKIKLK